VLTDEQENQRILSYAGAGRGEYQVSTVLNYDIRREQPGSAERQLEVQKSSCTTATTWSVRPGSQRARAKCAATWFSA
jgi:hypothetical protein